MRKFRSIGLVLVAVAATAFAMQDEFLLTRSYKEGDKDTYKLAVTANMSLGSADINMLMNQTVKKVYETGEADIETQIAEMRMSFGGQEMPMPNQDMPAMVQKFDKFGRPVGQPQGASGGMAGGVMSQMSFMRYAGFTGEKPLKVGETLKIDVKDEKEESHTTGTVLLEKITDGVAFITSNLEVKNKQTGSGAPMKIAMKSQVLVASGKLHKVDGDVTNLPDTGQGMTVDSVKLLMERTSK